MEWKFEKGEWKLIKRQNKDKIDFFDDKIDNNEEKDGWFVN